MFELYDKGAPALSTRLFSIGSIEILDKMVSSKINKLLYPVSCKNNPFFKGDYYARDHATFFVGFPQTD